MTPDELFEKAELERERQLALTDRLMCCSAAGCTACGGQKVREALRTEVAARGLEGKVEVCRTGCMGMCSEGPLVRSTRDGMLYAHMEPGDAGALVSVQSEDREAFGNRRIPPDAPFFALQKRVVLENAGRVDPERLYDYIAVGGYQALGEALHERTPRDVLEEIKTSGLRGRGGAGYPTGVKWELVAKQDTPVKYVICNADEGDPGAFMDRSVLEGDPHRLLEGMALAGYAVGATQGYIYVRGEYQLPIQRLRGAIAQAEAEGVLGARILESGFSFRIDVRIGAGAFVCGEETALIASIEGRRGQPRQRPPYPPESGLWGRPTLINNVETFANVPAILRHGGEWFASIGTEKSKGTKVFALTGQVMFPGLIEVPMGTSLRTIVFDIAGGIPGGKKFKAAQTGGPSGGCIPVQYLDMPVDYESLASIGSIMGSGGLIVLDQSACMVDVARFFMDFSREESCGKCIPCRAGTVQMHAILDRIARGEGREEDLDMLERLANLLRETSLCGLGQSAPTPTMTTLKYFRDEYEAHVREHRCAAGRCVMTVEVPV